MYVTGAIASSKGNAWCGSDKASPDAIQEQVYITLKSAFEETPKDRPAAGD